MNQSCVVFVVLFVCVLSVGSECPKFTQIDPLCGVPYVVGHRGIGYRPPHILEGYEYSVNVGTEYVEVDLVSTKDGVLVALHDNEMTDSTDVSEHPEYASLKTEKTIYGVKYRGWFSEDFTFSQIKNLRKRQYVDQRPHQWDNLYTVASIEEILQLVQNKVNEEERAIGVYIETKKSEYFSSIGLALEPPLLSALEKFSYNSSQNFPFCQVSYSKHGKGKDEPSAYLSQVYLQSFETYNLRNLSLQTNYPLIQLISSSKTSVQADTGRAWSELITDEGLAEIAQYASGIGPDKSLIYNSLQGASDLVSRAHELSLQVHPFTFKSDDGTYSSCSSPEQEYLLFYSLGVDGVFSDFSNDALSARNTWYDQTYHPDDGDDDAGSSDDQTLAIAISMSALGVCIILVAIYFVVGRRKRQFSRLE